MRRPILLSVLFWLYPLTAIAMAVLAVRPDFADADGVGIRVVFVVAATSTAAIGAGALTRRRWVPAVAVILHALITAVALAGLVSRLIGAPLFSGGAPEFVGKSAVHAAMVLVWRCGAVRRHFAAS